MASTPNPNVWTKLTKRVIEAVVPPAAGQTFLRDTEIKGFALRITACGARSFVLERRIHRRVRRITIARYPDITVQQARDLAQEMLGVIAKGGDPQAQRRQAAMRGVTLKQAYDDYVTERKGLKPRTLYEYEKLMCSALHAWWKKPLREITSDGITHKHKRLGRINGPAYANSVMRFLRALFNFAQARYKDEAAQRLIVENPVEALTEMKAWYRVKPRKTVIKPHQLANWFKGVLSLKQNPVSDYDPVAADYLQLLILTGLRSNEGASLEWDNVDLEGRTLTIPDPKNGEPHTLPLSDYLYDLLKERDTEKVNNFVFPGPRGYLADPRDQLARVIAASDVTFIRHDLRRTFATIAEAIDIPAYALKKLLNHKVSGDVTADYIVKSVERLRAPMQRITDHVLRMAEIKKSAEVVILDSKRVAQQLSTEDTIALQS